MELYRNTYNITNIEITLDKNYQIPNSSPINMNIVNDYVNRRLPVIYLTLSLDRQFIKKIFEHKNNAKIKFELYENEESDNKVINKRIVLKKTYTIIPAKDITEFVFSKDKTYDASKTSDLNDLIGFEMYLIDMTDVDYFDKKISAIFRNSTRAAALQALFVMRNVPSKSAIVTPPEDNSTENNIVIPLGDLIDNIEYINKVYGIYSAKAIIFKDIFNIYCINKLKPNVQIPSQTDYDIVTFMLNDVITSSSNIPGSYNDLKTKTHYVCLQDMPLIEDMSSHINNLEFATLATVDNSGNVNKETLNTNKSKMAYIYKSNNLTMQQHINERIKTDMKVGLVAIDCSIRIFKPYKTYNFQVGPSYSSLKLTADKKFRLIYSEFNFTKNGNKFDVSVKCGFDKI